MFGNLVIGFPEPEKVRKLVYKFWSYGKSAMEVSKYIFLVNGVLYLRHNFLLIRSLLFWTFQLKKSFANSISPRCANHAV